MFKFYFSALLLAHLFTVFLLTISLFLLIFLFLPQIAVFTAYF
ncbi:hypothetical protein CAMRE0001_2507 [Campylobacter rectus RM3267]|uniref:Uncharacterized protein n=1 Tax=Campylobacter rectus RM3267 TaxID=553218 RepID=B9D5E0_CAMRE|nr:hypothetical protein CAMRE0001_2507 [Campylobacter rectus RM3267]